jgi:hypothetical protein
MAPVAVPSGSTFQDVVRIAIRAGLPDGLYGRNRSPDMYHRRLLFAYGIWHFDLMLDYGLAEDLRTWSWMQLMRRARTAGFRVKISVLKRIMDDKRRDKSSMFWIQGGEEPFPYLLEYPAFLTACNGCRLPMFTDTTTRQFCNGCLRRHERNKKRNQRGTDLSDRLCRRCDATFTPKRSTAQFCSTRCRVAAHRA